METIMSMPVYARQRCFSVHMLKQNKDREFGRLIYGNPGRQRPEIRISSGEGD